jgi:hypothetical protein
LSPYFFCHRFEIFWERNGFACVLPIRGRDSVDEADQEERARRYRDRADELRAIVPALKDEGARLAIVRLAASYEHMADCLEDLGYLLDRLHGPATYIPPSVRPQPPSAPRQNR